MKYLLTGGYVFLKDRFVRADVSICNGRIEAIGNTANAGSFDRVFVLNDRYIVPGFVDVHVHLREPGFSYKETIATGTKAAVAGGYTAVLSMPNLNPVPDTPEHLALQTDIIQKDAVVRVYPYGAITQGRKGDVLVDFAAMQDAVAFSDDGTGVQNRQVMQQAMQKIAATGKILAAHCEDESLLRGGYIHDGAYAKAHGHLGICSESEWGQVARDIALVRQTGVKYHVCHVSAKETVELVRAAKKEGLPVTCETGPHYLTLTDSDLQEQGRFKMNPPLRGAEDRAALIEGLLDGTVDCIATDHAPHSAEEKSKGLAGSLMGVVGLETAFGVLYTHLVKPGILSLETLIDRMCIRPRRIFGLPAGEIAPGAPADLAVLDLGTAYRVDPDKFVSMGKATPFAGMPLLGQNTLTFVGGTPVWQKEEDL